VVAKDSDAPYCEKIHALLLHIGELKPANISYDAQDIYKSLLRILHNDFPEFVTENHFQFCKVICIRILSMPTA